MTTTNNTLETTDVRALTEAEIGDVGGGSIMIMGAVAVRLAKFLESINYKFFGCTTENGFKTCSSQYDAQPSDM